MKSLSIETQRELVRALRHQYQIGGPRGHGMKVIPFAEFAAMSRRDVDKDWDFYDRHRMHRFAKLLTKARAEMGADK